MAGTVIDLSNVPGVVTLTNNGKKKLIINISGYNQAFPLEPTQILKIKAETASEVIGYLSQVSDDNGLDVDLPVAKI